MGEATVIASTWRLIEVGRVVLFNYGEYEGKLAAICEIIDHKRILVEAPHSKKEHVVTRQSVPIAHVSLTPIVIEKLPRAAGTATLKKLWQSTDVEGRWNNSAWAKSRERGIRRRQLNDFERFKVMRLRKQARFEVRKTLASARQTAKA
ncbi:hypothetical protein MBLNU230_g7484t1 [Neophaeotheca triangularis]